MATPRPCALDGPTLDRRIIYSSADLLALRGFSSVSLVRLFRDEPRPLLTQGRPVCGGGGTEWNASPIIRLYYKGMQSFVDGPNMYDSDALGCKRRLYLRGTLMGSR